MNAYSGPQRGFGPPPRRSPPAARRRWQSGPLGADTLAVYGSLLALLAVTALLGTRVGGMTRPVFILGCVAVCWRALKAGPAAHVEVVTILFTFAPFLRRVVDVNAGYDPSGIMLVGPLLGLALPVWELKALLLRPPAANRASYTPYLIMVGCLAYGWILSAFAGEAGAASGMAIKMFVPVLYAMYLIYRQDACEEVLAGIVRGLMFVAPIIGLYGVVQYVLLPSWDRFWMVNSVTITAIGYPEPLRVRVFSTMNSPASFGTYLACGLLFYGFSRRTWLSLPMLFPISLGLLLSLYRTSWIGVALCICFCFMFNATRTRATLLTLGLLAAGILAIMVTPFGEEIGQRLMTMLNPSHDVSGNERMREYLVLYSDTDHYLLGNGMARAMNVSAQMLGIDGQFIASPVMMGILVGNIHVLALIWACLQGVFVLRQDTPTLWLVVGSIVVTNVLLLPLNIISIGEIGFPIWTFAALLEARKQRLRAAGTQGRARMVPTPARSFPFPPRVPGPPVRVAGMPERRLGSASLFDES